jgi:DNA-3-methyladenine glycosylase II
MLSYIESFATDDSRPSPPEPVWEPPVTSTPPDASRPRKVTPRQAAQILAERDPVLARLLAEAGPPSFPKPTDTHFATLVRSITYQQLAGAAARAIHGRLILALDGDVTPDRVLATPTELLRKAGLSGAKVVSIQDLAAKVLDGTVVLDSRRLARESDGDLVVRRGFGLAWNIATPTPKQLDLLGEPYRPYRSVVAWYCWRAAQLYGGAARTPVTS